MMVEEMTPYLVEWRGYFGLCQTPSVRKSPSVDPPKIVLLSLAAIGGFNELRRRGVTEFRAAVAVGSPTGFWRMSGHTTVQGALRNHHFDSTVPPDSMSLSRYNSIEPPWYATRMPGGVAP